MKFYDHSRQKLFEEWEAKLAEGEQLTVLESKQMLEELSLSVGEQTLLKEEVEAAEDVINYYDRYVANMASFEDYRDMISRLRPVAMSARQVLYDLLSREDGTVRPNTENRLGRQLDRLHGGDLAGLLVKPGDFREWVLSRRNEPKIA